MFQISRMVVPTVERFLCCCQLKTGVLIIGAVNLVSFCSTTTITILTTTTIKIIIIIASKIGALLGVLGSGMSLGGLSVVASGVLDDLDLEDQQLQQVTL